MFNFNVTASYIPRINVIVADDTLIVGRGAGAGDEDIAPAINTVGNAQAGNYIVNVARKSPLLNKEITVQVVAPNSSAASKIAYEAKRAGAEIVGVTQKAGQIAMEITALGTSILMMLWLLQNVVTQVTVKGNAEKTAFRAAVDDILKKVPGSGRAWKWAAGLTAAGIAGKYIYDRVQHYNKLNEQQNKYLPNNPNIPF